MDELDRIAGILPPTTWKSVLASTVYYSTFPVVRLATVTLYTVLALSAPLIHLITYVTHVLLLPLSIFGKLETFYIYFGVASLVGLLAGTIVYFTSRVLVSVLGLKSTIPQSTPYTVRTPLGGQQERNRRLRDTGPKRRTATGFEGIPWYGEPLTRENVGYLDRGRGVKGLSSQIILEEASESDL